MMVSQKYSRPYLLIWNIFRHLKVKGILPIAVTRIESSQLEIPKFDVAKTFGILKQL